LTIERPPVYASFVVRKERWPRTESPRQGSGAAVNLVSRSDPE
jgi:hypothetical protein